MTVFFDLSASLHSGHIESSADLPIILWISGCGSAVFRFVLFWTKEHQLRSEVLGNFWTWEMSSNRVQQRQGTHVIKSARPEAHSCH